VAFCVNCASCYLQNIATAGSVFLPLLTLIAYRHTRRRGAAGRTRPGILQDFWGKNKLKKTVKEIIYNK
jgi:hypothetical protein